MMAFPDDTNAGVDLRPISNPWIGQLGKSRWKACDVSSSLTASGTAYKRDVPAMSTSENPERTRSSDLENPQGVDRQKSALGRHWPACSECECRRALASQIDVR
jgi:hypothetical protein